MVIASGVGGGYDTYARTLSQYLEKHIPGNPGIINQNMEGAAGLTATNWGFRLAPKDGTVILAFANAVLLERLFGNPAADYDSLEFAWIGSIARQQNICMTWHTSPVKTIDEAKQREVIVSATGVTGGPAAWPKVVNAMLATRFKVIGGYSTAESRLAVERGEVEGICGLSWSTLKASNPQWVQNHRMNVLLQTGTSPQPELRGVPLLLDLATNEEDKGVLKLLFVADDMGRPFAMPPGTPRGMVEIIRRAFDAAVRDKEFLADAEKRLLEVDPLTGEEMERLLRQAFATPQPLVKKAAGFFGR